MSSEAQDLLARVAALRQTVDRLEAEARKRIVGQEACVRLVLTSILSNGHALLVGVPGLAKTELVKTIARCLDMSFKRIQFTPDLMPSDITGTEVIREKTGGGIEFDFQKGPIFANIVLADEINRTPPKTQAALLEAMQERQVTNGDRTRPLPAPFMVLATQNPIEQEGTYPLPEAQLDRFMFMIAVDYPSQQEEESILERTTGAPLEEVRPVCNAEDVLSFQRVVDQVAISKDVIAYAAAIARATRPHDPSAPAFVKEGLEWGAGPRAGQFLVRGAKALAAIDGRLYARPKDVADVALPVLRHRIVPSYRALADGISATDLARRVLESVKVPEAPRVERKSA
ncbi:MAG: AAA family ATPase [Planctomycetota bacterium]